MMDYLGKIWESKFSKIFPSGEMETEGKGYYVKVIAKWKEHN